MDIMDNGAAFEYQTAKMLSVKEGDGGSKKKLQTATADGTCSLYTNRKCRWLMGKMDKEFVKVKICIWISVTIRLLNNDSWEDEMKMMVMTTTTMMMIMMILIVTTIIMMMMSWSQ